MDQLAGLRAPMERLSALEEPMTRVAELGSIINRPWLFVIVGLVALVVWGAVTYVAVKLAIVSAAKVTRGVQNS